MTIFVKLMGKLAILAGIALLASCVTTFYVPQDTELTITIRHSSDYVNLELSGMPVAASTAEATLMPNTKEAGQWIEPNKAIFRSAQWGPEVAKGSSLLTAVWHVTLSPAPGKAASNLKLQYTKGHLGTVDITIEGIGEDGSPTTLSRHVLAGSSDANNAILFNTTGELKTKK